MAAEAQPNFRVNVYGNDPGRLEDVSRDMALGGPAGSGGGFPWWRGRTPSPTYPNTSPGGTPPLEASQPWEVSPHVPGAPSSPPGAAAGGAGAAGGIGGWLAGLSAADRIALLTALTGTVGGAMSKPPNMDPTTATTDPNLTKLMQTMQGRLDQSEPLYKSIMAMANGLLPTQYQNGGAGR